MDFSKLCRTCGHRVDHPQSPKWPLCARCERDPELQRQRKYRREARRCQLARVRAWRKGIKGKYYPSDVERLISEQGGWCVYCGCALSESGVEVDHIVPLSRCREFGLVKGNSSSNLQALCPSCNRSKGARTHSEYLEVIGLQ